MIKITKQILELKNIINEMKNAMLSHVQLFVTPWIVTHQASLSMEFSRKEHCRWLPFLLQESIIVDLKQAKERICESEDSSLGIIPSEENKAEKVKR